GDPLIRQAEQENIAGKQRYAGSHRLPADLQAPREQGQVEGDPPVTQGPGEAFFLARLGVQGPPAAGPPLRGGGLGQQAVREPFRFSGQNRHRGSISVGRTRAVSWRRPLVVPVAKKSRIPETSWDSGARVSLR